MICWFCGHDYEKYHVYVVGARQIRLAKSCHHPIEGTYASGHQRLCFCRVSEGIPNRKSYIQYQYRLERQIRELELMELPVVPPRPPRPWSWF